MIEVLSWTDFEKVDMRVGTILKAEIFKEARKPAYILEVDFGEMGILKSSAQITKLYSVDELVGKQVIGVINFPPKQIATVMSQCLILGATNENNEVVLLQPERKVKNGLPIS